jgi:hypothetical protein
MRALILIGLTIGAIAGPEPQGAHGAPPKLQYEDVGMCPFECCTYREWTVEEPTAAFTGRSARRSVAFRLKKGEAVTGITGVVVTRAFGTLTIRRATTIGDAAIPVKPGDAVHVIGYVGEGYWKFWAKGRIDQEQLPTKDQACAGDDGHPVGDLPVSRPVACAVQIDREPETEWWAQIRNGKGQVGWTKDLDRFGNIDACG